MSQVVGSNNSYKPIGNTVWVRAQLCKLQKGCTRLATASDKDYQLLGQGWWFSPVTPASSETDNITDTNTDTDGQVTAHNSTDNNEPTIELET